MEAAEDTGRERKTTRDEDDVHTHAQAHADGPDELLRALVRAHPTACLIGSAVLGFVVARLLRAQDAR